MVLSDKITRKKWIVRALAALAVLLAGLIAGNLDRFRLNSLPENQRGERVIPMEELVYDGFILEEGRLTLAGEKGFIHVPLDGQYVGKLRYRFDYDGLLNLKAYAGVRNIYGEFNEKDELDLVDRNSKLVKESYLNIGRDTNYVNLVIERGELAEPGLFYIDFAGMPLSILEFSVWNVASFHWGIAGLVWCVLGIAAFFWFQRQLLGRRVEYGFLAVALSVGVLMILALPVSKVGWDEEVHFEQAFWLSNCSQVTPVSGSILQLFDPGIDTWPFNQPGSAEEGRLLSEYWDASGNYHSGSEAWKADLNEVTAAGYVGQAIFLKAGQILHLPFSLIYRLGRLGNLLLYVAVLFLAIRITPVGKGILSFLGLMPTPMFQATVYSYDPTVTAFICLFVAVMLREALTPGRTMNWKRYTLLLGTFLAGCVIKAIYAPLLLMGLCIPRDHYRDERQRRWMRAGFLLFAVLLLLSFVLPVVLAPSDTGDLRGGDTSEVGQIAYILGRPLAYAWVLICNVVRMLPGYVLGGQVLGQLGHLGALPFSWVFFVAAVLVILTDTGSFTGKALAAGQKFFMLLTVGASVALIWTALYISYTEPGNTFIDGVQGRYYIPLLFPLYLVLSSRRVVVHLKAYQYHVAVLSVSAAILLYSVYQGILFPMCR